VPLPPALESTDVSTTFCPTCKRPVPIPSDTEPMGAFPFCCERCKLIDLGRWLDGKYQIPIDEDDDEEKDVPAIPDDEDEA
jgi:endogenous inhibitor of DNA gyrase (YacG/DUF329 family)